MTVGFYIFAGIVQGLTEFLPVSSSGHLVLLQSFFNIDIEGGMLAFGLFLHMGTLLAVVAAFWSDIKTLAVEFFRMAGDGFKTRGNPERRFILMLIAGTLPMFLLVPFKSGLDRLFESAFVVGCALLVTSAVLFLCDRVKPGMKNQKNALMRDAFVVGFIQCCAVVPGISRSGSTLAGGLFRGFKRDFAVRFSFILSIPAILGANILSFPEAASGMSDFSFLPLYLIGAASAAVSGYFAIFLVRLLTARRSFKWFSVYCAAVGIAVLAFL